jgi:hypothetical protein
MRMMGWIQVDTRNLGYNLPDWVGNTSYWYNYTLDWDSYLPYLGSYIDLHTKFSKSQFLMMISPISSHPSPSRPELYHHLRIRS